jgi:hypothetical protein
MSAPNEPEITQIAAVLANRLPTAGVPAPDAVDAWRGALRYARAAGIIEEITEKITAEDASLQVIKEELDR